MKTQSDIKRLERANKALVDALTGYMNDFPAFRSKPAGSPGSDARKEQERDIALEDAARAAIKLAKEPA